MMVFQGDIWSTGLDVSPGEVEALGQILSTDEWERADRFKFPRHKRRFIVARGRLRQILARYLHLAPQDIVFTYSQEGKPALEWSDLCFNLSHTGDLAIYGISWHGAIGIDLEFIRPVGSLLSLTKKYFCESEQKIIERSENQTQTFFRIWTAKEAYLKATGEGIAGGLQQIEISLEPSLQGSVKGWILRELPLEPDYVCTLCYRSQD
ncbi:MAG: 4'-phosphopantetheinyl transferase superfamily protein [Chlorogloea purpurea SAG 13.99]|nr:4'-phosphopantetheinyl transferase superfamily protein [Chlorogloea purpurea SAG 13.99]